MGSRTDWKRASLAIGGLVGIGLVGGAVGGAVGAWQTVCYDCPSVAQLYNWQPRQSTTILSHDGQLLGELALERRTPVDIDSLPDYVPQAFIAIEDKRFYRHGGYDLRGYARALRNQLTGGVGGGSTITLQLARHMFIEEVGFDQSLRRKLRELHVAVDLEGVYSKDQILEAYINQINYDNGWYGIESAAQNYFGKHATELNPAEAAMLAAVINLPAYYNPLKHPERARNRRNLVLSLMADQDYLTGEEAERWKQEPVPETRARFGAADRAPYFVEWVRRILEDRYGRDLYSSGYRVYTTLDVELQERARQAMERGWARVESMPAFDHPHYHEVAADSIPPSGTHRISRGSSSPWTRRPARSGPWWADGTTTTRSSTGRRRHGGSPGPSSSPSSTPPQSPAGSRRPGPSWTRRSTWTCPTGPCGRPATTPRTSAAR